MASRSSTSSPSKAAGPRFVSPAAPSRKQARRDALFLLYQTEVTDLSMEELVRGQRLREGYSPDAFTVQAVAGVLAQRPALDELLRGSPPTGRCHAWRPWSAASCASRCGR